MAANKDNDSIQDLTIGEIADLLQFQEPSAYWLERLLADSRVGVRALATKALRKRRLRRQEFFHTRRLYRYQKWLLEATESALIVGVDEVGRGPLAGPVVAAAVALPADAPIDGLDDSKRLSDGQRRQLVDVIRSRALCWGVGQASAMEIDSINVRNAAFLAMRRALEKCNLSSDVWVLVDGNAQIPGIACRQRTIVGGDRRIASIAAASILAKVFRDDYMIALDAKYPLYGFASNKGYGTSCHLTALQEHGPIPEHRRSFAPVDDVQLKLLDV